MASEMGTAVVAAATQAEPVSVSSLVDFVAGTVAGIVSLLVGHPFDTIKTRLQAQAPAGGANSSSVDLAHSHAHAQAPANSIPNSSADANSRTNAKSPLLSRAKETFYRSTVAGPSTTTASATSALIPPTTSPALVPNTTTPAGRFPIYTSSMQAFRLIVRHETFYGLYKGVTSPMLGVALMNASIFGLYSISLRFQQDLFPATNNNDRSDGGAVGQLNLGQVMVAGMISGLGTSIITCPIDLIKIRQQMMVSSSTVQPSTYTVIRQILATEGIRHGLFRGWTITAVRDLGYGPYFFVYELFNRLIVSSEYHRRLYPNNVGEPTNIELAISGGLAGVLAWVSTFWADVLKTKIQSTRYNPNDVANSSGSIAAVARSTYQLGGYKAFFAGLGPTVLRAIPTNAALFLSFEATKQFLTQRGF